MPKPKGLGRGLDALLGSPSETPNDGNAIGAAAGMTTGIAASIASGIIDGPATGTIATGARLLPIADIDPNRQQPRKHFPEIQLMELADSIRSVGVIQPIIVCKNGARYDLIAGERRWRAARLAGLTTIPALVREYDDMLRLEVSLVENLQREDLNAVEEALAVQKLMEECGYTQEAVAQRLGKSRPAIANLLRLLTLDDDVLALVRSGQLSAGHARALVGVAPAQALALARRAIEHGWSVRQMEQEAAKRPATARPPAKLPPELGEMERLARDVFGTKAQLTGSAKRGKLTLHYFTEEDLERIYELLQALANG